MENYTKKQIELIKRFLKDWNNNGDDLNLAEYVDLISKPFEIQKIDITIEYQSNIISNKEIMNNINFIFKTYQKINNVTAMKGGDVVSYKFEITEPIKKED